jgi:putative ABC transport system substrate-binding protein
LRAEGIAYEEVVVQSSGKNDIAKENLLKLDEMKLDLIYSLSSAGTQIAKDLKLKTPVIATVIGHPRTLGVAGDRSGDADPLTGTSYYVDAKRQLALYRSLFPNIRKVGMIFDAKNPAGFLAEEPLLREACKDSRLDFASVGVSSADELPDATARLIDDKVDIIVVPTNNLVYEALAKVLSVSDEKKIPVVSMNKQGVEAGALAGLFADTYYLGRQTANLARTILVEKKPAGTLAFQYIPRPDVILNMKTAKTLDYEFPPDILGEAAIVLQ